MEAEEAVKYLADVQYNQLRKAERCGKLQFTLYGKCPACQNYRDCQKLDWVQQAII